MNSVGYCSEAIISQLRFHKCSTVLDVGCGNGAMTAIIKASGFDVTGIEPDLDGFNLAKGAHSSIRFENLGAYDDTSSLGKFDAVISSEVIEHLFDPSSLLNAAKNNLNPNGVLILTCPFYGYVKNLLLSITNRWDDHHQPARVGGHIKLWSAPTMRAFLAKHGFKVETLTGAGRPWPLWASMVVVAKQKTT